MSAQLDTRADHWFVAHMAGRRLVGITYYDDYQQCWQWQIDAYIPRPGFGWPAVARLRPLEQHYASRAEAIAAVKVVGYRVLEGVPLAELGEYEETR